MLLQERPASNCSILSFAMMLDAMLQNAHIPTQLVQYQKILLQYSVTLSNICFHILTC